MEHKPFQQPQKKASTKAQEEISITTNVVKFIGQNSLQQEEQQSDGKSKQDDSCSKVKNEIRHNWNQMGYSYFNGGRGSVL